MNQNMRSINKLLFFMCLMSVSFVYPKAGNAHVNVIFPENDYVTYGLNERKWLGGKYDKAKTRLLTSDNHTINVAPSGTTYKYTALKNGQELDSATITVNKFQGKANWNLILNPDGTFTTQGF
ncbi:hypothetical protein [Candidatus Chromulinivorax destructor]|uniref:DUF4198 domain-containing protein n=1 Tax=Candidatus Chromulinivorax destructor TaxID=2066483 RepID=A0A345ZAG2_9BACT|nr:hypothetical protein [Candidatus Chromulinivorax destructor]AXK60279.1 hypothetical protein C0J27_00740 [Candidatus Chromulinivorax destructor]